MGTACFMAGRQPVRLRPGAFAGAAPPSQNYLSYPFLYIVPLPYAAVHFAFLEGRNIRNKRERGMADIMLRDTHIAAGVSVALFIVRPRGLLPAAAAALSAACGADISDIDTDRSWARKKADVMICVSTAAMAAFAMFTAVSGGFENLIDTSGVTVAIGKLTAWALAVIICVFGVKTGHRSFMHSITAGAILTACVYAAGSMQASSAFLTGFLSHLALDLLNHKNLQLFWPAKKGVCLHVCTSNGAANKVLGAAFLVTAVLLFDTCSGIGLCRFIENLARQG